eukprot:867853-Amorphochlora_amoeboformis.AAC.1
MDVPAMNINCNCRDEEKEWNRLVDAHPKGKKLDLEELMKARKSKNKDKDSGSSEDGLYHPLRAENSNPHPHQKSISDGELGEPDSSID